MIKYFAIWIFLCTVFAASAQSGVMYRIVLTDKGHPPYSIDRPEEFLSAKSIERRAKQRLPLNVTDLPIDPAYFQALQETGATLCASSKWVNTITVFFSDNEVKNRIAALPFVHSMTQVWSGIFDRCSFIDTTATIDPVNYTPSLQAATDAQPSRNWIPEDYGKVIDQMNLNNALPLHEKGYKGAGISIAVIDAGFHNADLYPQILDTQKISGTKNFTHQPGNPYRSPEAHGAFVLSCMLAHAPGQMIGSAPEAHFYLLKSEVNGEEFPVEEDYWVAALEYADSLGVDIVNSSIGYHSFDDTTMNHRWDELDGCTVPASRAASLAASKGMVLFVAAGNDGRRPWQKTCIPADADNILTVGAVKNDSTHASFSSWGILADGRMKPDVMALGYTWIFDPDIGVIYSQGTSFATPVLAGMGACLWGAVPTLTAAELMALIRESADRYDRPDEYYGYGIPNIEAACLKAFVQHGFPNALSAQHPHF
ncbi:MAG: S8 family serine peptidase [Dysgonamonadaceae bacterium]|jgi:subtilisin family serine protease|nr:S8 family serine peptidase [Dysgonamonadaceae bacterium]